MNRRLDFLIGVPLVWILSLFVRKARKSPAAPQKILLIKLAAVGDTVLLMPVLRALRKVFPDAQIDWLVSSINRDLAKTVPYVNRVVEWRGSAPAVLWRLIKGLREETYEVVIDVEQWARGTALLSFFTGAPVRLGFDTPRQYRAPLFTATVRKTFLNHEIQDFFQLLSRLHPLPMDTTLELWETEKGQEEIGDKVPDLVRSKGDSPWILIHPGCGRDGGPREWPLSNYAVLAHWLKKEFNAQLILTAGPDEIKKTFDLNKLLGGTAVDLGGRLSWPGTVSLVRRVDLVVSGNTGIMHIAAAFRKSQVALHGPTNPALWGPLNPLAKVIQSPCEQCPCLKLGFEYHRKDQACMEKIQLTDVKKAISALIDKARKI